MLFKLIFLIRNINFNIIFIDKLIIDIKNKNSRRIICFLIKQKFYKLKKKQIQNKSELKLIILYPLILQNIKTRGWDQIKSLS